MTKSDVAEPMKNINKNRDRSTASVSFKCLYNYDFRYFYLMKGFY
ncbi:hypothetical protein EAI05_19545 [Bacillus subtilis]|nr:hypothetical protein D9C11_08575 [Bacillus subtilis subsp. subtilis]MCG3231384.1 hypothetical protein [Bacillus subtilis]RNA67332.1 hypothetical protein EAI05_19545 [Bacillus subtilis]